MSISWLRWRRRRRDGEAEGLDGDWVGSGDAIFASDDGEAAGVVPHGPADVVFFEGGADVVDPGGAVGWVGSAAIHAKFVTGKRDVPLLTPGSRFGNFCVNARGIPAGEAVMLDGLLVDRIGNLRVRGGYVFRGRGIRKIRQIVLEIGGPRCALVSKDVRVIEMKIVNDVGVVQRFEEEKFIR